jgi:hypothetical protein
MEEEEVGGITWYNQRRVGCKGEMSARPLIQRRGAQGPCVGTKCEAKGAARYICDWRPPQARVSPIR